MMAAVSTMKGNSLSKAPFVYMDATVGASIPREAAVANQRRYLEYCTVIPFVFRIARRSAGVQPPPVEPETQPATAKPCPVGGQY